MEEGLCKLHGWIFNVAEEQTTYITLSLGLENWKVYFSETILQHVYLNLFLGDCGDGSATEGTNFCAIVKI